MAQYDVIVVGSGASGGPLAARLSEDPSRRVLLIEAGPAPASTDGFPKDLLDAGLMSGAMPGHPNNWSFVAKLTPELPYLVSRGKILGGSSSLNGTYYIRGRKQDFDTYAAQGNTEWSFEKVLPYYEKLEHDLAFEGQEGHEGRGPVPIYRVSPAQQTQYTKAFIAACRELGFGWEEDKNSPTSVPGVGLLPMNAVDNVRMNTGITYVNPARSRANFDVWGDTLARKVLFDGTTVTGLEVGRNGGIEVVRAAEIVIAAGAFKSPHLLALSGIGPRAELEAAGISVLVDLPGVGKDFSDHPDISFNWSPTRKLGKEKTPFAFQAVLNFNSHGSQYDGDLEVLPMMRSMMSMMGMEQGSALSTMWGIVRRPGAFLKSMKGVSIKRFAQQMQRANDLAMAIAVQQAESRGNVFTVSADPLTQPKIEYNYLSDPRDVVRMREVVRTTIQILQSQAFKPYFKRVTELDAETLASDAKLDVWMKTHLATAIHASGSCAMGSDPAAGHVVDQFGRVHGVSGLRVADTSILPFVPSRGPAATAMLIGERVAGFMTEGAESAARPAESTEAEGVAA
ncbi:GMC family oxidoreductase [Microterricola viridarii]|uniref:GMC oxidoreductase n=1 Tax=Microterricola viridarii TaxID=412690 RepID=A0A1H1WEL9_9MICO|nr:GMC family oxidoreductase N-terminal domain-containing protein [Microterricola viridarii]SDS95828.1 GMC oxidoreductase [Microterricola viridarii]